MKITGHFLVTLLVSILALVAVAPAAYALTADQLVDEMPTRTIDQARKKVTDDTRGGTYVPKHQSTSTGTLTVTGTYTPTFTGVMIAYSDDGVSVTVTRINGTETTSPPLYEPRLGKLQALGTPDSFQPLSWGRNRPLFIFEQGNQYYLTVEYDNKVYGGAPDIDGVTLIVVPAAPSGLRVLPLDPEPLLGTDLKVQYEVQPGVVFLGNGTLTVRNQAGQVVFQRSDVDLSTGTHETKWPSIRWDSGEYANPNNGPYTVTIEGTDSTYAPCSDSQTTQPNLRLQFEIQDAPPAGSAALPSGLGDIGTVATVHVTKNGGGFNESYSGTDTSASSYLVVSEQQATAPAVRRLVYVFSNNLEHLANGTYTIAIAKLRDDIGNYVAGLPITYQIRLR